MTTSIETEATDERNQIEIIKGLQAKSPGPKKNSSPSPQIDVYTSAPVCLECYSSYLMLPICACDFTFANRREKPFIDDAARAMRL
jgi:hypothetical protein